ncbi:7783_t:CDS:1, partial [Gigaspora rosea]
LPTPEESTTNSTTTIIPPSTTSTKTTDVPFKIISELQNQHLIVMLVILFAN